MFFNGALYDNLQGCACAGFLVVAVLVLQIINSTLGKAMGGATGGYTAGQSVFAM